MISAHTQRVIDSDQYLVVTLAGKGTSKPDLVISVVTGYKGDNFLHVEPFAGLKVSLEVLRQLWFKNDSELLTKS